MGSEGSGSESCILLRQNANVVPILGSGGQRGAHRERPQNTGIGLQLGCLRIVELPIFVAVAAQSYRNEYSSGCYNAFMPQFTHHIFVCCNQREPGHSRGCCDPNGNEKLRDAFKSEIKKRGLKPLVRANTSGCLDQCELGPTVVIYPQAVWYGGVKIEDVPRIVAETIVGGRVIEELRISDEQLNCRKK